VVVGAVVGADVDDAVLVVCVDEGAVVGGAGGAVVGGKKGAVAGAAGGALVQHHKNKKAQKKAAKEQAQ